MTLKGIGFSTSYTQHNLPCRDAEAPSLRKYNLTSEYIVFQLNRKKYFHLGF